MICPRMENTSIALGRYASNQMPVDSVFSNGLFKATKDLRGCKYTQELWLSLDVSPCPPLTTGNAPCLQFAGLFWMQGSLRIAR